MSNKAGNTSLLPPGFMPIRHGLRQHIKDGRFTLVSLAVYIFLLLEADWFSGIYRGTALGIALGVGDAAQVGQVQRALARLRSDHYINYPEGTGRRGKYPILVNKYLVTVGERSGMRLNAFASSDLDHASYEPWNGERTVQGAVESTVQGTVEDTVEYAYHCCPN